jgi:alpha-tubulin suppressor-like RCC1 family protein
MVLYAGLSCGGEHTLLLDRSGALASVGACGLGWNGQQPNSQAKETLDVRAQPCSVSAFFATVVARTRQPMPPMQKAIGGYYHSMAISTAGKLFAWGCGNFGAENDGQLGLGRDKRECTSPAEVPLVLEAGETVVDAAAGCYHSAALTSKRRVLTFGLNNYGQLGRDGIAAGAPVPRSPPAGDETDDAYADGVPRTMEYGGPDVEAIGAGFYNVYLLTRGGGLTCAGSNAARQCGSAEATHTAPADVPELSGVPLQQVAGGYCHTVALGKDGTVFTLGCGEDGQRGDTRPLEVDEVPQARQEAHDDLVAEYEPCVLTKVAMPEGSGARAVVAGANHSLALSSCGRWLWGWGSNEHGQLGESIPEGVSTPRRLALPLAEGETIQEVDAGYAHTAVLTSNGRALLFGRGENGQLGGGAAEDSAAPVVVLPASTPCE